MTRHALALFACALLGCSGSSSASDRYGRTVAEQFARACNSSPASPSTAKLRARVCSCTAKEIPSRVRTGDSQAAVEEKIEAGRRVCLRKVYPNGI